jgi:hypothetical protein
MSKFDIRYSEILNEANGFLGGLGKAVGAVGNFTNNVASGIGSGINAAQNPFDATKKLIQGAAGLNKKAEERGQNPISAKNPVKKGEPVWCNSSIYSIVDRVDSAGNPVIDPKTKSAIKIWDVQQATIRGFAESDSDKTNGKFQVKLSPDDSSRDLTFFLYKEISGGRGGQPAKSTSIVVVGVLDTIPPTYKDLSPIYIVGPMENVEQGLKNWYIIPKNQQKA